MTRLVPALILLFLVGLGGCSTRDVYNNLQSNQRYNCEKLPLSQSQDCLNRTQESYDAYQQDRKQVLAKPAGG